VYFGLAFFIDPECKQVLTNTPDLLFHPVFLASTPHASICQLLTVHISSNYRGEGLAHEGHVRHVLIVCITEFV
jgi:hypothetical protein